MLTYRHFWEIANQEITSGILKLHESIFEDSDTLEEKIKSKRNVLLIVALVKSEVVGYKIGYELDKDKYYSWYGGVHKDYRSRGIASKLMEQQHRYLAEIGYRVIQTKTRNKWRDMLVLNIKNGFDVLETFRDDEGIHRIILEKKLRS